MIEKKFKTPLYGSPFTVIIYDNDDEFRKRFKGWEFQHTVDSFDGAVFKRDGNLFIVFSAEKKGFPTPGIIAHESFHLMNEIFIDISHHTLDRENDEPEAYLLTWIVNRIHELINKKTNKK